MSYAELAKLIETTLWPGSQNVKVEVTSGSPRALLLYIKARTWSGQDYEFLEEERVALCDLLLTEEKVQTLRYSSYAPQVPALFIEKSYVGIDLVHE